MKQEVEHHSLDDDERFAEDHVVLSACDDEQEAMDCLFGDDDFERFKALPVMMDATVPPSRRVTQIIEETESLPPAVAFQQPKQMKEPASFKISPDHP